MIVDSSALVAVLHEEADAAEIVEKIVSSSVNKMSAASYVEVAIVVDRDRNPVSSRRLDELLSKLEIAIVPVTEKHARLARDAYRDFGRGSGHAAKLNFGDCFAYALAKDAAEPLLFKGNDFTHTDVEVA